MKGLLAWLSVVALAAGARAAEVTGSAASFPAAFAAAARQGLGQDPFYASALLNSVEADVRGAASLRSPAEVKTYLENAAGAADARGMAGLRRSLETGRLPADQAAAMLTASALAQPELFMETLDSLEGVRPGLGSAAAGIFAKAEGSGAAVVAALRRAVRRQPAPSNGTYGRDGRWETLFDGAAFTAVFRETAATGLRAPAPGYGPRAETRGAALLPRGAGVLVKTADGGFESLSDAQFERRFGARLLRSMPRAAPDELAADHANYRSAYESGLGPRPDFLAGREYSAQLDAGRPAALYIAKAGGKAGYGAFAARALKAGDFIGEYTGAWRRGVPYDEARANGYLFEYPMHGPYVVDASREGSLMRFVNHSAQNANARVVFAFHGGYYRIVFVAKRGIAVDEQVLIDYGPKYWDSRGRPEPL